VVARGDAGDLGNITNRKNASMLGNPGVEALFLLILNGGEGGALE